MWCFHHVQNRELQETILHVRVTLSAHTPHVRSLEQLPPSVMFSLLWFCNSCPPMF